jgi:hypothetical protein
MPACPSGLDDASEVGDSASSSSDVCTCDTCQVTQAASCAGHVTENFDTSGTAACGNAGAATDYDNMPDGTCQTDLYTGARPSAGHTKLTLAAPSGGACAPNPPTVHVEDITLANRSRLCTNTARCAAGVCDGRVPSPFMTCIASPGDVACPAGFAERRVVGDAAADCTPCSCSVVRAACTGRVDHFTDNQCMNGVVQVTADGTCRANTWANGSIFLSYKVVATSATTCNPGTSSTIKVKLANQRTVCCR